MASYQELFAAMPTWRRVVTIAMSVLALVVLVLIVTGTIGGIGVAIALGIVVVSFLVGPRSPLF